jgi:acetyl esterase/lipase
VPYNFDPELVDAIAQMPAIDLRDPVKARAAFADFVAPLNALLDVSGLTVTNRTVPAFAGKHTIPIRIYAPERLDHDVPGLLYIHGGGFVIGSLETEHASAALIAAQLGIVVVSVDYRLAPEHPFPAGLDDCHAALQWVHSEARALRIDTRRIGVFGMSAGGGLSAALALRTRDQGGPRLCFQFLGIPELDDRLDTPSMRKFVDTPVWNRPGAELSWEYYLGDRARGAEVSCYAAPARAAELANLPPAFISAMEFDPLRDEAVIYALGLMQAGVPVELHVYPGTFHGSSLVPAAAVSQRQLAELMDVLRRGLRC